MKQPAREELDTYYRDAATWADDRAAGYARSQCIAWIVAGVAATVALAEAFALVMLMPLKTVVPYTLLVDKQTGYVQTLKPLEASTIAPDTALTQSFLVQYVLGRESFDIGTVKTNYQKVASWTAGRERANYVASMQASNAASPLALYPRGTVIETNVKSVSPIAKNTAMVRFDTVMKEVNGRESPPQPWVATIDYSYSGEPLSVAERFINPLGFQVTRYRRDPEALPVVASPAAPSRGDVGTQPVGRRP